MNEVQICFRNERTLQELSVHFRSLCLILIEASTFQIYLCIYLQFLFGVATNNCVWQLEYFHCNTNFFKLFLRHTCICTLLYS